MTSHIVDYIGEDQRYGLILGVPQANGQQDSILCVYLFDSYLENVSPLVEGFKFDEKEFDITTTMVKICNKQVFVLTKNLEFLRFDLRKGSKEVVDKKK